MGRQISGPGPGPGLGVGLGVGWGVGDGWGCRDLRGAGDGWGLPVDAVDGPPADPRDDGVTTTGVPPKSRTCRASARISAASASKIRCNWAIVA